MLLMLEIKNSFMFFLSLSITLAFARMLYTDKDNWSMPYYGAMIGVVTYFAGATLQQAWQWAWCHFGDGSVQWITPMRFSLVILTGIIMSIGAACIIRNFTVSRFGHKAWIIILSVTTIASVVVTLGTPRSFALAALIDFLN